MVLWGGIRLLCFIFRKNLEILYKRSTSLENVSTNAEYGVNLLNINDFYNSVNIDKSWFSEDKLNSINRTLSQYGNYAIGILDNSKRIIAYGLCTINCTNKEEGYLWQQWVCPQKRGLGLYQKILTAQLNFLRTRGKTIATLKVALYNKASRHGIKKIGFKASKIHIEKNKDESLYCNWSKSS